MDEHDKQHLAIGEALKVMESWFKALNELRHGMEEWLRTTLPAQQKFMKSQMDLNKLWDERTTELVKIVTNLAERVEALEKQV